MSIRPVQITLPTPPPAPRPLTESSNAPTAAPQAGVSVVSDTDRASQLSPPGTALAGKERGSDVDPNAPNRTDKMDRDGLAAAVERAQKIADSQAQELSFSVHEKTGEVVVKIIDRESKEVIRQIPAEEMLRIAERMQELEGKNKPGLLLKQEV